VQGFGGLTPYIVVGNAAIVILAMLMLVVPIALARMRRRRSQ
jgi:apolipoprotein N-acyltransferase